jgi:hypothetical protein
MRAAIIENGVVINIAVADPDFATEQGWIISDTAQIGDTWDGETLTSLPVPVPEPEPSAPTKEELFAQLQALQAQIESLGE